MVIVVVRNYKLYLDDVIDLVTGEDVTSSWLSDASGNVTSPVAMTTAAHAHGIVGTHALYAEVVWLPANSTNRKANIMSDLHCLFKVNSSHIKTK